MLIIDTHAHIYSEDEKKYRPIETPYRPPSGSGSVSHLKRLARENGVKGVCIVQTSTFYRWDNRFICDTAVAEPSWTAGVCTLDPDDAHSPGQIQHYAQKYGIRAMRSIPGHDGKMDSSGVAALWKACGEAGLTVNVLCNRDNTAAVARMFEKFRQQPIVIDHCLNLKAGPDLKPILADMLRLAKYSNSHAKLTFLATGTSEQYPFRDMHEPCRQIIAAFGPERCIWGSDFPCELWTPNASYAQNLRLFTHELGLEARTQEALLGATANRLYFRGELKE
jgi:predicted TIM-barrel fold metal-dependent hydrolase